MSSHPVYSGVRVAQTLVFCLVFCRSVFFLLFFFFCWPFCCLSFFNLRLLITPSVYSNFSFSYLLPVQFLNTSFHICTSRLSWICGNPYYSWVIDALHSVIYVDIEGCADLVLYVDIEGWSDFVLYYVTSHVSGREHNGARLDDYNDRKLNQHNPQCRHIKLNQHNPQCRHIKLNQHNPQCPHIKLNQHNPQCRHWGLCWFSFRSL
jgi:hypothetical protein